MKKPNENEYLYLNTSIHAKTDGVLTKERADRLTEARSAEDFMRMLLDFGFAGEQGATAEEAADNALREAFGLVEKYAPDKDVYALFRYPYDCHNLKSAIKVSYRNKFSYEELATDLGSADAKEAPAAVLKKDFSVFPKHMATAAKEAIEAFDKTGDPQRIDLLLDAACYADMLENAEKHGVDFIISYIKARIDTVNVCSAARCISLSSPLSFFKNVYIVGGTLALRFFEDAYGSIKDLKEAVLKTEYGNAVSASFGHSMSETERAFDILLLKRAVSEYPDTFGEAAAAAYIIIAEGAGKNIRLAHFGKVNGLEPTKIRERMRDVYV
ncbi:MAG: V-type ATPase subunit [Clostridia bacterium]|nr:V-type ATPase subunit [Clostridia bacterium]